MFIVIFLDNMLGFTVLSLFSNSMAVIGTVVVICYSTPIFLVVVIPLGILYYFIQVTGMSFVYVCAFHTALS